VKEHANKKGHVAGDTAYTSFAQAYRKMHGVSIENHDGKKVKVPEMVKMAWKDHNHGYLKGYAPHGR
jgi:hypothetical protein